MEMPCRCARMSASGAHTSVPSTASRWALHGSHHRSSLCNVVSRVALPIPALHSSPDGLYMLPHQIRQMHEAAWRLRHLYRTRLVHDDVVFRPPSDSRGRILYWGDVNTALTVYSRHEVNMKNAEFFTHPFTIPRLVFRHIPPNQREQHSSEEIRRFHVLLLVRDFG